MHQDVYCGHLRAGGSAALFWPWMSKELWLMKSIKLLLLVGMDMTCHREKKQRKHHKIDMRKAWDFGQVIGGYRRCKLENASKMCVCVWISLHRKPAKTLELSTEFLSSRPPATANISVV